MKAKRILITLAVILVTQCVCGASMHGPSGMMSYFKNYKGSWETKEPLVPGMGRRFTESTSCHFSHEYNVFEIHKKYNNGQISFSESVTIMNIRGRYCSAILYREQSANIFIGSPSRTSKMFVMKTTNAVTKKPEYLVIDFTPCPKGPPKYKITDKKPKE